MVGKRHKDKEKLIKFLYHCKCNKINNPVSAKYFISENIEEFIFQMKYFYLYIFYIQDYPEIIGILLTTNDTLKILYE